MQTILKNVSERMWKRKAMWIPFFLFTGCAQHDESMAPGSTTQFNNERAKLANTDMAAARQKIFIAHLNGGNEVPVRDALGQGEAVFSLNKEGTALHYKLNVANAKDITQAHIHCGDDGVNGPIVVFLFGFVAEGVNQNGVLAEGTINAANIIPRDSSATCMTGITTFETLLERMRSGGAYVNVHTLAFPGGEIRGQIK